MIEIALYNHQNDTFEKQNYPFVAIEEFTGTSFADFTKEARAFILRHSQDQVVVINKYPPNFDFNLFAIALTVESLRTENYINCVAIQVSDLATATEAFKPFIALTFGLKYVHTLQEMDTKSLFRDLSSLGYLGLKITHHYTSNSLIMSLNGSKKLPSIEATTFADMLTAVGYIKTLALMKKDYGLEIKLSEFEKDASFDEDVVFSKVVELVAPLI